jgi:hypothetical protein
LPQKLQPLAAMLCSTKKIENLMMVLKRWAENLRRGYLK